MRSRSDPGSAATGELYLRFARYEARGKSPMYERLGEGVAGDRELLALLASQPPPQRQPNLLFAAVRYLGSSHHDYASFRGFVLDHASDVLSVLERRRTQTNEVGRCATLLPALGRLRGPLALLEVGASGGLCLLPDRYAYRYNARSIGGPSPVLITCEVRGEAPIPRSLPEVVWRRGIDLRPLDVFVDDDVRWLESCVWPDQQDRLRRLRAAIRVARQEPPLVVCGDLLKITVDVAAEAPRDTTLVVFHSATLAYLLPAEREAFAGMMTGMRAVWLSNEAADVIEPLGHAIPEPPHRAFFVLGQGGKEMLALADPHGEWLEWRGGAQPALKTLGGPGWR